MQTFAGIVQKGAKRGGELGYPTMNIPLCERVSGVYVAMVKIGEKEYEAAAFADGRRKILEAHILDFSKDLYGWNVKITLLKKIRESRKFTDDKKLRAAIAEDVVKVRKYFRS